LEENWNFEHSSPNRKIATSCFAYFLKPAVKHAALTLKQEAMLSN